MILPRCWWLPDPPAAEAARGSVPQESQAKAHLSVSRTEPSAQGGASSAPRSASSGRAQGWRHRPSSTVPGDDPLQHPPSPAGHRPPHRGEAGMAEGVCREGLKDKGLRLSCLGTGLWLPAHSDNEHSENFTDTGVSSGKDPQGPWQQPDAE